MSTRTRYLFCRAVILPLVCLFTSCEKTSDDVTVYVSLDRHLAEPVLAKFESDTQIEVKAVYDTEANKTSGLVNRLLAEASRPRADVFWNNEVAQMFRLSERGVLADWEGFAAEAGGSSSAIDWAGFAARGRVLVVTPSLFQGNRPSSIDALVDPQWKGKAAIANPRFGTTGTHFSALLSLWGETRFREWLRELQANDVAMLPGNAQVKDAVVAGRYSIGLSDTDDVNAALRNGHAVELIIPDQDEGQIGLFVIPNAVALIEGGPSAVNGQLLTQYLLSPDVEGMLAQAEGAQIPIRHEVPGPSLLPALSELKVMQVDYDQVGRLYERMIEIVDAEWPR